MAENETVETIDLTPTWEGILPGLIDMAVNGTSFETRSTAAIELRKMARLADAYVAEKKAERERQREDYMSIPVYTGPLDG